MWNLETHTRQVIIVCEWTYINNSIFFRWKLPSTCNNETEIQVSISSQWLTNYASEVYGLSIPSDFILLALDAMKHLQDAGRLSVVYDPVKGFGQRCPDGSDSYFPTKLMPMGLLQYMAQFKPGQKVSAIMYSVTTYCIAGNFHLELALLGMFIPIFVAIFLYCIGGNFHYEIFANSATRYMFLKILST